MGRTLVALCPSHDAQDLDRGCLALFTMFADGFDSQQIHGGGFIVLENAFCFPVLRL